MNRKKTNKKILFEMMEKINPDFKLKKTISESYVEKEIEFGTEDLIEVVFYGVNCRMVDVGIGWDHRGKDRRMEPECDDVQWDTKSYTDEENETIKKYLHDNYHEILKEIKEKYDRMGGDEPPEPERD